MIGDGVAFIQIIIIMVFLMKMNGVFNLMMKQRVQNSHQHVFGLVMKMDVLVYVILQEVPICVTQCNHIVTLTIKSIVKLSVYALL